MRYFVANFKWFMLLSGFLTCSMFPGLFSPESPVKSLFNAELKSGPENIIVRNWSAVIGLMGIMLIYGAFKPAVRQFSLIIAGLSKVIFIGLVLNFGKQYMAFGTGAAVVVDCVMIFLFLLYLLFSRITKTI
jgi:hypothetical protein